METENIEQVERVLSNVDYTIKELAKIHDEVLEKMVIEINRLKFGGKRKNTYTILILWKYFGV